MNLKVVDPGLKVNYVPDAEELKACFQLGKKIGGAL